MRIEVAKHLFVEASNDFLLDRNAVDAGLIYETEAEIDESLYWIIGNSYIRIMVMQLDLEDTLARIANIRPPPSFYVVYGTSKTVNDFLKSATAMRIIKRDSRWNFVITDFSSEIVDFSGVDTLVTVMKMAEDSCCVVLNKETNCECGRFGSPVPPFLSEAVTLVTRVLDQMKTSGNSNSLMKEVDCEVTSPSSTQMITDFEAALRSQVSRSRYKYDFGKKLLTFPVKFSFSSRNKTTDVRMGTWSIEDKYVKDPDYNETALKRFFSVGTVARTPWTYFKGKEGQEKLDRDGNPVLTGYCPDMVARMAEDMKFDYEILLPSDGSNDFGRRDPATGEWSGLIRDLVSGRVDIAVAPMTMTSEREEVIDFVAPYFDQSGISIIHRKAVVPRSLFKFLQVLKTEVWFAILGALTVTAIMIWLLDK